MKKSELAKRLDVTYIPTRATWDQLNQHLETARQRKWRSFIGPRCWIPHYVKALEGTGVLAGSGCCDINGSDNNHIKCYTVKYNAEHGCDEVDMVMNIGYFNSGMYRELVDDVKTVKAAAAPAVLKCAVEVGYWSEEALKQIAELMVKADVAYVKTGTWGAPRAPETAQVQLLREALPDCIRIKVAPFDGTLADLEAFLQAGADCFGVTPDRAEALWKEAE